MRLCVCACACVRLCVRVCLRACVCVRVCASCLFLQSYVTWFHSIGHVFKSVSVSAGHGQAQADTGPQALPDQQRSCPCLSFVISWFPSSTFLICSFEPWRRLPVANLASPRQGRRIRVALPTPGKSQKMDRRALRKCSFPSSNCRHPRPTSHFLNNEINRSEYSFFFTEPSHRVDRASTSQPAAARYGYLGPVPSC